MLQLKAGDLHLIADTAGKRLKVFDAGHVQVFICEVRDKAIGGPGFGHQARCPRGEFRLGAPRPKDEAAFGEWFLPIEDFGGHHAMGDHGRAGIGLHGGGKGLRDPFAPRQGWIPTEGCLRLQNEDLEALVKLVDAAQGVHGHCFLTVI